MIIKCEHPGCNKKATRAIRTVGKDFLRCKKHAEEFINVNMAKYGGSYPIRKITEKWNWEK